MKNNPKILNNGLKSHKNIPKMKTKTKIQIRMLFETLVYTRIASSNVFQKKYAKIFNIRVLITINTLCRKSFPFKK